MRRVICTLLVCFMIPSISQARMLQRLCYFSGVCATSFWLYYVYKGRAEQLQAADKLPPADSVTRGHILRTIASMPNYDASEVYTIPMYKSMHQLGVWADSKKYFVGVDNIFSYVDRRMQYMVLAHECGHLYYHDTRNRLMVVNSAIVGAGSVLFPVLSHIASRCVRLHPVAQGMAFVCAVGSAGFGQFALSMLANKAYSRHAELRADRFALQQARCLADIESFRNYWLYSSLYAAQCSWLDTHPSSMQRARQAQEYYNQRVQEGWK